MKLQINNVANNIWFFFPEDPNVDLFAKKNKEKKERVAKNELQRLRNIARSQKSKGKFYIFLLNCNFNKTNYVCRYMY